MKLEEERLHLIERVSSLQLAQSEHEKAIEKVRRDQEERTIVIVSYVPTQMSGSDYFTERTREREGMVFLSCAPVLIGIA